MHQVLNCHSTILQSSKYKSKNENRSYFIFRPKERKLCASCWVVQMRIIVPQRTMCVSDPGGAFQFGSGDAGRCQACRRTCVTNDTACAASCDAGICARPRQSVACATAASAKRSTRARRLAQRRFRQRRRPGARAVPAVGPSAQAADDSACSD